MWKAIFGGILVFAGFYLIIKSVIARKKGIHMDAKLVGFSDENGTQYPLFQFTHEGEELTISGGVSANPSNRKYVDIEGSYTEFLYAIGAIVLGAIFIYFYLRGIGVI